jgi:alpha/beta superfamily hydrolase
VGLRTACPDDRVKALIGLGVPAMPIEGRIYDLTCLRNCAKPKLFVSGTRDKYAPVERLKELVSTIAEPKQLVLVEAADHFFEGRLREVREAIEDWLKKNGFGEEAASTA